MYFRLSNIATRKKIEEVFQVPFNYPYLFNSKAVINGLKETALPIITSENPEGISFGIWGILPENYSGKWKKFQQIKNTLFMDSEIWNEHLSPFHLCLKKRRCFIIATGLFVYRLENNKVLPSYLYTPGHAPFCVAGIYTRLDDGFITCALLTSPLQVKTPNYMLDKQLPIILSPAERKKWIDPDTGPDILRAIVKKNTTNKSGLQFLVRNFHKSKIKSTDLEMIH